LLRRCSGFGNPWLNGSWRSHCSSGFGRPLGSWRVRCNGSGSLWRFWGSHERSWRRCSGWGSLWTLKKRRVWCGDYVLVVVWFRPFQRGWHCCSGFGRPRWHRPCAGRRERSLGERISNAQLLVRSLARQSARWRLHCKILLTCKGRLNQYGVVVVIVVVRVLFVVCLFVLVLLLVVSVVVAHQHQQPKQHTHKCNAT
jgi:hypothetical protein